MELPEDYTDALVDELAPYGFEFSAVSTEDDAETSVVFEAEPESFARTHRWLGIEDSYGAAWPPEALELWLRFDRHGDPVQVEFEVFDLLAATASLDPQLHARLSSMDDPQDHAVAVGEALRLVLEPEARPADDYLE